MQKVTDTDNNLYRVEKILQKRTRGKTKEIYVKWEGCPQNLIRGFPKNR